MSHPKDGTRPELGHRRLLLAVWVCELSVLVLFDFPDSIPRGVIVFVLGPLFATAVLAQIELVYRDARMINREKGSNVIDATLWSLLSLLLSFIALPLYVFVKRKAALSTETTLLQNAFCSNCGKPTPDGVAFCSACGSRLTPLSGSQTATSPLEVRSKPLNPNVVFLAVAGAFLLVVGYNRLIGAPPLDLGFQLNFTIGVIIMSVGLIAIVRAGMIYKRGRAGVEVSRVRTSH